MLLKNFASFLFGNDGNAITVKTCGGNTRKPISYSQKSTTNIYICTDEDYDKQSKAGNSPIYNALYFGTGTVQPTIDDYKLSGDIITTLQSVGAGSISIGNNGITFAVNITNTGVNAVTINEVAFGFAPNSGSAYDIYYILTRDVLSTPIVIEAGGKRTVEVFIDTLSLISNVAVNS